MDRAAKRQSGIHSLSSSERGVGQSVRTRSLVQYAPRPTKPFLHSAWAVAMIVACAVCLSVCDCVHWSSAIAFPGVAWKWYLNIPAKKAGCSCLPRRLLQDWLISDLQERESWTRALIQELAEAALLCVSGAMVDACTLCQVDARTLQQAPCASR